MVNNDLSEYTENLQGYHFWYNTNDMVFTPILTTAQSPSPQQSSKEGWISMSSFKMGYGLPARPSDGIRSRRLETPGPAGGVPRLVSREEQKETETTKPRKMSSLPKPASRMPQPTPSSRLPSNPQPSTKPLPDRHSRSWGSTTTAASATTPSGIPKSHAQTESGSSSSSRSYDDSLRPSHNILRRKRSSVSRDVKDSRKDSSGTSSTSPQRQPQGSLDRNRGIQCDRMMTESPAEIRVAEMVEVPRSNMRSPVIYPELDRYREYERSEPSVEKQTIDVPYRLATQDLPPPTPASLLFSGNSSQVSGFSGSPSTRLSESPGPGPYSRDTTPTSMSSQSSSYAAPSRINPPPWSRQNSPAITRPPVTRRRAGSIPNDVDSMSADPNGLAAVRESLTSSSSNSTVRDGDKNAKRDKRNRSKLPPPPPSPPPRKSSQKFRKPEEKESPLKQPRDVKSPTKSIPAPGSRNQTMSPPRPAPPARPSRDGTADIKSQLFSPVPVIQSNLLSARPERRGSEPTVQTGLPRSGTPLSQTKKNASTSNLPASKESSLSRITSPMADAKKLAVPEPARPATSSNSSTSSSFNSRFPFFSRRKTAPDVPQTEKAADKKKLSRKGPAAGTGHEGYGRIGAARRRSSSGGSNLGRGSLEASQESLASSDPFLADRVNPVVISGGAVIENRNDSSELSREDLNLSIPYGRPSTDSKAASDASSVSAGGTRNTLWPSAIPRGNQTEPRSRRPSDSSDSEGPTTKPTLAFRRSIHRLGSSSDNPLKLPHPINTSGVSSSPMTSFDTSVMSDESYIELQKEVSRGSTNAHPAPKKLKKRAPSPRKWNLFGRSQTQSDKKKKEDNGDKVAATVTAMEKRPVPFYAMMDSPERETETMDVQEVLRFADVYTHSSASDSPETRHAEFRTPEMIPAAVDRSSPQLQPTSQRQTAALPAINTQPQNVSGVTLSSGRPSRLPQVGRIPQVVSNRQEKPSPRSFSRPFRASLQMPTPAPDLHDVESIAKGPSPKGPSPAPEFILESSALGQGDYAVSSDPNANLSPDMNRTDKEFFAFSPPRKYSNGTIGTSSSSSAAAFAAATAVIPNADDPPVEDEVWDEFDDLLGDDKPPQSATSSKGVPFHLETYHTKLGKEDMMESPTLVTDSRKVSTFSKAPTHSTSYSADMTERIRTAFQPHPSPTVPLPANEAASSQGKKHRSLDSAKPPVPMSQSRRSSSNKARNSACSSSSSEDTSPLAQVNLRVGSMTVSKWLTFGHVLFSDIRHDLAPPRDSLQEQSILVIDGLGNDDWSFYAAETYPAATFFNLSPRAPLPAELQNSPASFPLSPPNHHQIQYRSNLEKFPFAPQSFTSVVFRFPVAAPESHYKNILSEARRVLKPDGFIELSILDVDLNNMGNRGRRTVRQLKEGIHEETPETSLGSTADLIVRLLGKAGFSSIKAARVGVPVASSNPRRHSQRASGKKEKKKDQPSLAEMMSDNSTVGDESITNMVAKVGRWWYTRCYETAAGSSQKSIWNDKPLLSECEELGTSLKLMVCCARAPDRITSY